MPGVAATVQMTALSPVSFELTDSMLDKGVVDVVTMMKQGVDKIVEQTTDTFIQIVPTNYSYDPTHSESFLHAYFCVYSSFSRAYRTLSDSDLR